MQFTVIMVADDLPLKILSNFQNDESLISGASRKGTGAKATQFTQFTTEFVDWK